MTALRYPKTMSLEELQTALARLREGLHYCFELLEAHAKMHPARVIPAEDYEASAGVFPQASPEGFIMRPGEEEGWEVLLLQRPEDDTGPWAGMWHVPGVTMRYNEPLPDQLRRLSREVLDTEHPLPRSHVLDLFATTSNPNDGEHHRGRGPCLHTILVYVVTRSWMAATGTWVDIKDARLDQNVIEHHRGMLAVVEGHILNPRPSPFAHN